MSHFVTFGSSGYSSKFTTIFSRKVRGHSNYVNFSFSTQYKIAIFFRVSFHHHEIRSLYSRIFLAKWLLENENVTNPYDPSKDSIRDLQWGRNRFPMSKLVPSSSSLARKTKWLKGIEKFFCITWSLTWVHCSDNAADFYVQFWQSAYLTEYWL